MSDTTDNRGTGFSFDGLRARSAPEPTPLPGAAGHGPEFPFTMSYPDPSSLPIMEAHAAMGEVLAEVGDTPTVYPDTQGYPPLREYVADFLGRERGMDVSPTTSCSRRAPARQSTSWPRPFSTPATWS